MARFGVGEIETAAIVSGAVDPRAFVDLGILYSVGRSVPIDRVQAHKWFNIAASRGCREAVGLRQELASEMTRDEVAEAQRHARLWLAVH